ncbi:MAG: UvrD-helicase domain-containing protein [Nanobdellota archaeon]
MKFNKDGSLKAVKKKQDHVTVFRLIDELDFPVGKKLLVQLLRGELSSRIKKLGLDDKVYFGSLGGYDSKQLLSFIEYLLKKEFVQINKIKNRYAVVELTSKGEQEIQLPAEEMTVESAIVSIKENTPRGKSILEIPRIEPAKLSNDEKIVCQGLDFFFENFSEEQKKAIIQKQDKQACIAGAGSGKTSVLTYKIAYLIRFASVDPSSILAITFTRKAKRELQLRLETILGSQANDVRVETFNSFAEQELLKHGKQLYGFSKTVVPQREFVNIVTRTISNLGFDVKTFLRHYFTSRERRGKEDRSLLFSFLYDFRSILDEFYSEGKNTEIFKEHIKDSSLTDKMTSLTLIRLVEEVSKQLEQRRYRTYGEQISDYLSLIKKHPDLKPEYSWILVDEYQDVNDQQKKLIETINPGKLFVVGDPRQSIFAWRGSDPSVMLSFVKECLESNEGGVVELTRNFRSFKKILSFANAIIAQGKQSAYSPLETHHDKEGIVQVKKFSSESEEADSVINSIKSSRTARRDIFVLSRTNKGLEAFENKCKEEGISYLLRTEENAKRNQEPDENQITLSTIHAIKGLEASIVFVVGSTPNNFPCKAKNHRFVELFCSQKEYDSFEEERRLFYVACTRAKKELIITTPKSLSPFVPTTNDKGIVNNSNKKSSANRLIQQQKNLKKWRFLEAKRRGIPAYAIFTNAVLEELLNRQPSMISDLHSIRGLSNAKIDEFGQDILHVLMTS